MVDEVFPAPKGCFEKVDDKLKARHKKFIFQGRDLTECLSRPLSDNELDEIKDL